MDDFSAERLADIRNPGMTAQEVKTFYDKWSEEFDKDLESLRWNAPRYAAEGLSKLMTNKDARILDCAAGTGLVGQELHRLGYKDIDALDMSQAILDQAQEKGIYKKLICAKIGSEPIEGVNEDSYDAIVCSGAFLDNHLDDSCLTEWVKIVRRDGLICIGVNANTLFCVEGPKLESLLERKALQQVEKYQVENFLGEEPGYFIAYRVV
ncbi:methyltransferase-like protein 27 isoform X2 [Glandiceps talaboti]